MKKTFFGIRGEKYIKNLREKKHKIVDQSMAIKE